MLSGFTSLTFAIELLLLITQYRLCLVAEFRSNVTSYIVITLIQVQDAMDVQVIAATIASVC